MNETTTKDFKRKIYRQKGAEWCAIEIRYESGRLSIVGDQGEIVPAAEARRMAREYWESYFDDDKNARHEMNERCGTNYRTSKSAAKYVVDTDGEYHGLDVDREENGKVWLLQSCGQIREDLEKWFPEFSEFYKWHLNDMKAGCEHQEALGWGRGFDVALTANSATPKQLEVMTATAQAKADKAIDAEYKRVLGEMATSRNAVISYWQRLRESTPKRFDHFGREVTGTTFENLSVDMCEAIQRVAKRQEPLTPKFHFGDNLGNETRKFFADLRAYIAKDHLVTVEPEIFKDSLCAPCPECGYKYGTRWLKREIPEDVLQRLLKTIEDAR